MHYLLSLKSIIDEEMQWALELSDLLLAMDHRTSEVTRYRAKAALLSGDHGL